jgi:preprotein translocase subunit Sec61beta
VDPDLILVIGMVVGVLAIPSLLGAYSESRTPRVGAIMVMISAGLISLAIMQNPNGYTFDELPDVFFGVVARILN